MQKVFADIPKDIEEAIGQILSEEKRSFRLADAENLHNRYLKRAKGEDDTYLNTFSDALAYLALRVPATYAQIYGALSSVQEVMPSFTPQTILDIGSGPGTGALTSQILWPSVHVATCVDVNDDLMNLGKKLLERSKSTLKVSWVHRDVRAGILENNMYDIVLLANVLNELDAVTSERLLVEAHKLCRGILIIVEPGTEYGNAIVQSAAERFADTKSLIAPYIDYSFVKDKKCWLHFSQRFIRPSFQRRIRQQMRDSASMASDWEDAKYSYVTISTVRSENISWGRSVGPVKKQKGFLELPILTKDAIIYAKVMKRHKKSYTFAKNVVWGQLIPHEADILQKK